VDWRIRRIFNFSPERWWADGCCAFGFHGRDGTQYVLQWDQHWLGCLSSEGEMAWTAGAVDNGFSRTHIPFPVRHPHYITELPDGSLLVSSNGANEIFRLVPAQASAELFLDTGRLGLKDVGNCEYDGRGSLWVHEIEGCRVWQLDLSGKVVGVLGDGRPGFQAGVTSFHAVRFNWIYDLRLGPEGDIYVLDSRNFAVRRIDVRHRTVSTVAGTGRPGYSGDGGPALEATLGSDPREYFDGPLSLSIDEAANIFIGDTHNHVVRMVDGATQRISTIAGRHDPVPGLRNDPGETDPLALNLPKICSLDYHAGRLFIPDVSDDLVVLEKVP